MRRPQGFIAFTRKRPHMSEQDAWRVASKRIENRSKGAPAMREWRVASPQRLTTNTNDAIRLCWLCREGPAILWQPVKPLIDATPPVSSNESLPPMYLQIRLVGYAGKGPIASL